jgi:hypothetical protein
MYVIIQSKQAATINSWINKNQDINKHTCKYILKKANKPSKFKINIRVEGKAFPLQAWIGPWGSRRLRLQNF